MFMYVCVAVCVCVCVCVRACVCVGVGVGVGVCAYLDPTESVWAAHKQLTCEESSRGNTVPEGMTGACIALFEHSVRN